MGVVGASALSAATQPAMGVEAILNLTPQLAINPRALYFFWCDGRAWQFGSTLRYAPPVPFSPFRPYVGAGAAWTWTTLGGNGKGDLVWLGQAGLALPAGPTTPYVELQLLKYGTVESQLAAGIRLAPGGRDD
jgi:outer membrane protein W